MSILSRTLGSPRRPILALIMLLLHSLLGCAAEPASEPAVHADAELGVSSEAARSGSAVHGQAKYRAITDVIAEQLRLREVPGGAIAILEHNQLRFVRGIGVKEQGKSEPVDADTNFRIGSITKTFTAALASELSLAGTLSLDAPIARHVPELSLLPAGSTQRINLRRLLSHTAGMPDYTELSCAPEVSAETWFAQHPNVTLWTPPGRVYNYSNLGFSLAGLVLERATGTSYRELVQRHILDPLGLSDATFDVARAVAGNHARGYAPGVPVDATHDACALADPAGMLWMSARELGTFAEALLSWGDGALHPFALAQLRWPHTPMVFPPNEHYGLGMELLEQAGEKLIGHTGGMPGYLSAMWLIPERDLGVVVLLNATTFDPSEAAAYALLQLLGREPPLPPDWSTPPATWERYLGVYEQTTQEGAFPPPFIGTIAVERAGDALQVRDVATGELYPMQQLARDGWLVTVDGTPIVVTFWFDARGRAEYMVSRQGVARRVP